MDAIEIYFGAYGALLALAVAKLVSSAVRMMRNRSAVRVGLLTPLLMLLILADLCSLINSASKLMGLADLSLRLVTVSMSAAGLYSMIAAMAAPDDFAEWPDLNAYYDKHKRILIGGLLAGSLLGFEVTTTLVKGFTETLHTRWMGLHAALFLAFYLLMIALLVVRNRIANLVMLSVLNAIFLVVMLTF